MGLERRTREVEKMAKAVLEVVKVPLPVVLTLEAEEARTLLRICRMIGGSPHNSRRKHMDSIKEVLELVGVDDPGMYCIEQSYRSPSIFFRDETSPM